MNIEIDCRLHSSTSQKTKIFIVTTNRTANLIPEVPPQHFSWSELGKPQQSHSVQCVSGPRSEAGTSWTRSRSDADFTMLFGTILWFSTQYIQLLQSHTTFSDDKRTDRCWHSSISLRYTPNQSSFQLWPVWGVHRNDLQLLYWLICHLDDSTNWMTNRINDYLVESEPITVAARTLGSWVRIPVEAWMSVCFYSVFVLFCV
jgi:hypothetical protein